MVQHALRARPRISLPGRPFWVVGDLIEVRYAARRQAGERLVAFVVDDASKRHRAVVHEDVNRVVAHRVVAREGRTKQMETAKSTAVDARAGPVEPAAPSAEATAPATESRPNRPELVVGRAVPAERGIPVDGWIHTVADLID